MMVNVWKKAENLSQGCDDPLYNAFNSENKVSSERFDDAMAALTFAATVITIALGFLFNL